MNLETLRSAAHIFLPEFAGKLHGARLLLDT